MILVLSGTNDGRLVVENLLNEGYQIIVTTATDLGATLMEGHDHMAVVVGRLNGAEIKNFIMEKKIRLVIDATHPFAVEVSDNAMAACEEVGIQYLRFQRNACNVEEYLNQVIRAEDYEDAAKKLRDIEGNILLTTGSKSLEIFAEALDVKRLFPRILPMGNGISKCEGLGFSTANIIAMQGPFSQEMNEEIIKKYNIKILVTKESGVTGGVDCKLKAAEKLNIAVMVIDRPKQKFSNIVHSVDELIGKVRELYGSLLSHND